MARKETMIICQGCHQAFVVSEREAETRKYCSQECGYEAHREEKRKKVPPPVKEEVAEPRGSGKFLVKGFRRR
jgi:hypothetical protein